MKATPEAPPGVVSTASCATSPVSNTSSQPTKDAPRSASSRRPASSRTRANIEYVGAKAVDLLTPEGRNLYSEQRFKGDIDLSALEHLIEAEGAQKIPFCMITVPTIPAGD